MISLKIKGIPDKFVAYYISKHAIAKDTLRLRKVRHSFHIEEPLAAEISEFQCVKTSFWKKLSQLHPFIAFSRWVDFFLVDLSLVEFFFFGIF